MGTRQPRAFVSLVTQSIARACAFQAMTTWQQFFFLQKTEVTPDVP
jgi:hypothetical protein